MSQIHRARLRQQRQSVNPTRSRLATWDATDLIMQANLEGRPVSDVLEELIAEHETAESVAKGAARWELAANLGLVLAAIVVAYFFSIGVVATGLALGWSA